MNSPWTIAELIDPARIPRPLPERGTMTDTTPTPAVKPLTWQKARPMLLALQQLSKNAHATGVTLTFDTGHTGTVADGFVAITDDGQTVYRAPVDWPISGSGSRNRGKGAAS